MASDIGIAINVTSNAGPELDKLQAAMKTVQTGATAAAKGVSDSWGHVRQATQVLANELSVTLNPALAAVTGSLGSVGRSATSMGAVLGTLAAGVVGAAALFGQYVAALDAATKHTAELNLAVRAMDFSAVRSQMQATSVEIEILLERQKTWWGSVQNTVKGLTDLLGVTASAWEVYGKQVEASLKLAPFEQAVSYTQALVQQSQALLQLRGIDLGRAEALNDQKEYLRLTVAITDELLKQYAAEDKLLRQAAQRDVAGIEARGGTTLETATVEGRLERDVTTLGTRRRAAEFAIAEQRRRFQASHFEQELTTAVAAGSTAEQVAAGVTPADLALGASRQRAEAERLLTIDQARTNLMREQQGLSDATRLALDLAATEAERRLKVQQAGTDLDKADLANLEAAVRTTERLRVELEQQSGLEGLAAGFRTVADEASRTGAIMQGVATQVASNMNRAFSDGFFNLITGNFRKLGDVSNALGAAMLRTFTDTFAQIAQGGLFRLLSQGFGGSAGGFFANAGGGGGGGLLTGGGLLSSGGSGLVNVGGTTFQSIATGGGQSMFVPVGGLGTGSGSGATGISFSQLPTPPLGLLTRGGTGLLSQISGMTFGDIANFGIGGAFTESGAVLAAGGTAARAAQLGELGINTGLGGSDALAAGAGVTLGSAGTLVGGLAGLGFTIYSALQGPPTTQNIVMSGISGAVSGAAVGLGVALLAVELGLAGPTMGISLVVGAIIGALAGSGAAAMGKGGVGKKPSPAERSYQAALAGQSNLNAAIDSATSLEQLQQILNHRWSPYNEINIVAYDRPTHWTNAGYTNGPARMLAIVKGNGETFVPFPDVLTMLQDPRYIDNLEIQVAGPAGGGSAAYDAATTTKFQDKWATLLEGLQKGVVGFFEDLGTGGELLGTAPGPNGTAAIQRFTSIQGAGLLSAQGQQLSVSPDVLTRNGMTKDDMEQFLRLAIQVDKDRDLNILIRPETFTF